MYDEKIQAAKSMFLFVCSLCIGAYVTFQWGTSDAAPKKPQQKKLETLVYSDNVQPLDYYLKGEPNVVHFPEAAKEVFTTPTTAKNGVLAHVQ